MLDEQRSNHAYIKSNGDNGEHIEVDMVLYVMIGSNGEHRLNSTVDVVNG